MVKPTTHLWLAAPLRFDHHFSPNIVGSPWLSYPPLWDPTDPTWSLSFPTPWGPGLHGVTASDLRRNWQAFPAFWVAWIMESEKHMHMVEAWLQQLVCVTYCMKLMGRWKLRRKYLGMALYRVRLINKLFTTKQNIYFHFLEIVYKYTVCSIHARVFFCLTVSFSGVTPGWDG